MIVRQEFRVGHMCCGSGFGAKGFRKANARVGNLHAHFRNIGGIDVDPAGIADFERFAGCKGTLLDLMTVEQYRAFHGKEPPVDYREATTADIHRAFNYERPHIVFISAPCKGFSGLLSEAQSKNLKYQALNQLALRSVWLVLEAFKDDPIEFLLFENVPRIANRGRPLLDEIDAILEHYGYASAETTHDCGRLGGLAQTRRRFLKVARHMEKVPPFLYEPPQRPLRGVGEVLEKLPMPSTQTEGGMHRLPSLQWKTWVRLAFVEAGADWRSLNKLNVKDGVLADYGITPETDWRGGSLGVRNWSDPAGTVTGQAHPTRGSFSVADPRPSDNDWRRTVLGVQNWADPSNTVIGNARPGTGAYSVADPRPPEGTKDYQQFGVRKWDETMGAVINVKSPGQGAFAVSDPRTGYGSGSHTNKFKIVPWHGQAQTVTGAHQVQGGALSVSDPRASGSFGGAGKYRVTAFDEAAGTVIGGSTTGQGAFAVADPRAFKDSKSSYKTQGHYGVAKWGDTSNAVPGYAKHDRGMWSVADPRTADSPSSDIFVELPAPDQKTVAQIIALDGTWHRPFTTLELAALQSLFDPEDWWEFEMDGKSDSAWRERIGNAVPPDAAEAIATVMGRTLLLAMTGETFMLSSDPIWVRPLTTALSVDVRGGLV